MKTCPNCGAELVDGYIENMPALVCPNDCDYGEPA